MANDHRADDGDGIWSKLEAFRSQVSEHLARREKELEAAKRGKARAREARRQHLGREVESAPPSAAKKKPLFMEDLMSLERRRCAQTQPGGTVSNKGAQAQMQAWLVQRARAEDEAMARRVDDLSRTAASERLALARAIHDIAAFVEDEALGIDCLLDEKAPLSEEHTAACDRFDEHFAHERERVRAHAADDGENLPSQGSEQNTNNARLAGEIWSELFSKSARDVDAKKACEVVPLYLRSCNCHLPHLLELGFRVATAQAVRRSRADSLSGVAEGELRAAALLQDWRALSPFVVRGASSLLRQRARDRKNLDQTFLQALEVAEDAVITREMWETRLFRALSTSVGVGALLPTLRCVLGLAPVPLRASARDKSCASRGDDAVGDLRELFTPRTRRMFFTDLGCWSPSPPR